MEGFRMKRFSWILALIVALSIGFIGCPAGGDDDGGGSSGTTGGAEYVKNPDAQDVSISFGSSGDATRIVRKKLDDSEPGSVAFAGGGYTYTYDGSQKYENCVNRFKVELGEFSLADYGYVSFKWQATGLKEDASVAKTKNLFLVASDDPDALMPMPAEHFLKPFVVSTSFFDGNTKNYYAEGTGAPAANGNNELEIIIPIVASKVEYFTDTVWCAIYVHAEKDSYTIKDLKFVAGDYNDGAQVIGDASDAPPVPLVTATIPAKAVKYELDLSVSNCSDAGTSGINAIVPQMSYTGGKLTVDFAADQNNQRLNVKIDSTTKAALSASRGVNSSCDVYVYLKGEFKTGQNDKFRYHLGIIDTTSSWNATASFADNYPFDGDTGLTRALKLNYNGAASPDYFILQHQSIEASQVEISAIEVWILPPPPPAVPMSFEDGDVVILGATDLEVAEDGKGFTFTSNYGKGIYFKVDLPDGQKFSDYSKVDLTFEGTGDSGYKRVRLAVPVTGTTPTDSQVSDTADTYVSSGQSPNHDKSIDDTHGHMGPFATTIDLPATTTANENLTSVYFVLYVWSGDCEWTISNITVY
jgi:hypothetical protein